jgi:hypothetical protein
MTNTTLGRFQQDDRLGWPDLGYSSGMTFYNDLLCCLFWKVMLSLGPFQDLSKACPCLWRRWVAMLAMAKLSLLGNGLSSRPH